MKNLIRFALILAVPFVTTLAPAASQADKAEKVAGGLLKITETLTKAQGQIDNTLRTLNALATPGTDVAKQYEVFATELKNTQKMSEEVKKKSEQVQASRDKYLATWEEESKKIQNEQLRNASVARKAELQPTIDGIKTAAASARTTFGPFMQDLTDLNLYLGNNLSPSGIAAATTLIAKCNEDGNKVKADLTTAIEGLKKLSSQISPTAVAK